MHKIFLVGKMCSSNRIFGLENVFYGPKFFTAFLAPSTNCLNMGSLKREVWIFVKLALAGLEIFGLVLCPS